MNRRNFLSSIGGLIGAFVVGAKVNALESNSYPFIPKEMNGIPVEIMNCNRLETASNGCKFFRIEGYDSVYDDDRQCFKLLDEKVQREMTISFVDKSGLIGSKSGINDAQWTDAVFQSFLSKKIKRMSNLGKSDVDKLIILKFEEEPNAVGMYRIYNSGTNWNFKRK